MMASLFSVFDPSTPLMKQINWMASLPLFWLIPMKTWSMQSPSLMTMKKLMFTLQKEFSLILNNTHPVALTTITLFIAIALSNLMSLAPYNFSPTTHITLTMALAFPLWLASFMMAWFKNTSQTLAHTVPHGTPFMLTPFMVMIESLSALIRPMTLSIRLAANLIAGHLLITMVTSAMPPLYLYLFPLMGQIALTILETAVACIQAYVFAILITLYTAELA